MAARLLLQELFDIANAKGCGFHSGSFICEDPSRELLLLLQAAEHYERRSSHLRSFPGGQPAMFGTDFATLVPMVGGERGDPKSTVLFASVQFGDSHCVFLKPEEHGTQGTSLVGHAGTFITATVLGHSDANKVYRKERVPSAYKAAFRDLVGEAAPAGVSLSAVEKEGVFSMLQVLSAVGPGSEAVLALQAFVEEDLGTVAASEAFFRHRVGREVYMSEGETLSAIRRMRDTLAESPRAHRPTVVSRSPSGGVTRTYKRLVVTIAGAYNLRCVQRVGTQDPYAIMTFGEDHVVRTGVHSNGGAAATWNEQAVFPVGEDDLQRRLHFCVRNKNVAGSSLIGEGSQAVLSNMRDGAEHRVDVPLFAGEGDDAPAGFVSVALQLIDAPELPPETPRAAVADIGRGLYLAVLTGRAVSKFRGE